MFPVPNLSVLFRRPPISRDVADGWLVGAGRWLVCALILAGVTAHAGVSTEYQVKAAFLFNFTKFAEWPAERFADGDAPIIIGVLSRNPFGDELENVVRDRLVGGRRIVVRLVDPAKEAKSPGPACHVLFVPAGEESRFAALTEAVSRTGALTVGESERFAALGGMLNFVVLENRVRFEINRAAVEASSLKLRAQLQKLAAPARSRPGAGAP